MSNTEDSWQNTSPENRELEAILRKLGEFLQGSASIDWQENRERCHDILDQLRRGCAKSKTLAQRVIGAPIEIGGSEHILIHIEDEPSRVFKSTFGDNLGCRSDFFSADPELTGHFHATGNADPFFYLRRWLWLNSISDYQTRYEGIIPAEIEGQLPRICISQPVLISRNPTEIQIEKAMQPFGYQKISRDAFLNIDRQILLTDAAPRNVRILEDVPIPFDAIAELAPERVLNWVNG